MRIQCATLMFLFAVSAMRLRGQDLAPRAYVITPLHTNVINLTWSFYDGGLNFGGTVPITGATGTYNVPLVSYYHAFSLFGHSANLNVALPYAVGTFSGKVFGNERSVYRSGLMDFTARFSVNLIGGPAMRPPEFSKWKQKRILGASVKVVAPTGQYDGRKLVNWSIHRWAIKPEIGYSERWGNWILDAYGGVWFYTNNPEYYHLPAPAPQTEKPVGSFEGHWSYDFKPRLWASLDGNFWWGGVTALNGIRNLDSKQTSSRIGVTVSIPFTPHQQLKVAYSEGTYVRFGGNYNNVQVAWQYSWIGAAK